MNDAARLFAASLLVLVAGCAATPDETTDAPAGSSEDELFETRCETLSHVPNMITARLDVDGGRLHVRYGVVEAKGTARGDVLYLPGFADRLDNHMPLFEQWSRAGFRVVSFDYPSHGETCGKRLDAYGFEDLGHIASRVEEATREDGARPFVLSGWSTGGLVAVRSLEEGWIARKADGVVLFAPAVAARPIVGDKGFVTEETLTRNPAPPHRGPITPKSPFATPLFAPKLLLNASLACTNAYPNVPTLVLLGGDETDRYVDTRGVERWMDKVGRDTMHGRTCAGGYHELDNEPAPMGPNVRASSVDFAGWIAGGRRGAMPASVTAGDGACRAW